MKNGLPEFPNFEKLGLDHKDLLQAIAAKFPSSDFNFAGLFTWDVDEVVEISSLNNNLVIRSSDYLTHESFYSFIGDNKVDETIQTITAYAKEHGEETKLRLITESVAKNISPHLHSISEDRDNHDYIHLVNELAELTGQKYSRKRNLVNKFVRENGKVETKELDLHGVELRNSIKELVETWGNTKNKDHTAIKDELTAIKRALDHHDVLGIRAFGVYHKSKLVAFVLFEILPNKIAIGHFEKADADFKGIFEYLNHNFAKHLSEFGVEIINTEQDLGIEGLRKSKESYRPVEYIKKYTVERIK